MSLTRMREINFFTQAFAQKYKGLLPWFDQDVINVYFYQYPEKYLILLCKQNFLTADCNNKSVVMNLLVYSADLLMRLLLKINIKTHVKPLCVGKDL